MKIAILAITEEAGLLAGRLKNKLTGSTVIKCRGKTLSAIREAWKSHDALICIMACGIVVRAVCPLASDKRSDPAVLVLDQKGRFVIPLLSGHLGGANELAAKVAGITGGTAAVTTASDCSGHTPLDLWIRDRGLKPANPEILPEIMGRLVDHGALGIYSDCGLPALPADLRSVDSIDHADIVISIKQVTKSGRHTLVLSPPVLVAGIGCNRGTPAGKIRTALEKTCLEAGLDPKAVLRIASIDLKRDETGLIESAHMLGAELLFYSAGQLNTVEDVQKSDAVMRATGAKGVCEPAAILASGNGVLLVEKRKWKDVTIALAKAGWPWWEPAPGR